MTMYVSFEGDLNPRLKHDRRKHFPYA